MGDANPSPKPVQQGAKRGPVFHIPSAAEVAASSRPTAPPILFRPSSSGAGPSSSPPANTSQRPPFPIQPNALPFPLRPAASRPPFPPSNAGRRPSSFAEAFSFARDGVNSNQGAQRPQAGTANQAAGFRASGGNPPSGNAPGLVPTPSTNRAPSGAGTQGGGINGLRPTYAAGPVQAAPNKNAIIASNRQVSLGRSSQRT